GPIFASNRAIPAEASAARDATGRATTINSTATHRQPDRIMLETSTVGTLKARSSSGKELGGAAPLVRLIFEEPHRGVNGEDGRMSHRRSGIRERWRRRCTWAFSVLSRPLCCQVQDHLLCPPELGV